LKIITNENNKGEYSLKEKVGETEKPEKKITTKDLMKMLKSEKLTNVVSIELINLQVPMTFYNVEARQGNNFFYVYLTSTPSDLHLIDISDGNYSLDTLISAINTKIDSTTYSDISFTIDPINGKTTITSTRSYTFVFYEDTMTEISKVNHCLGWILGFQKINVDVSGNPSLIYPTTGKITSNNVAYIGTTKNITVVLDEFCQNQTSGTVVQPINDVQSIKPSLYFANSKLPKSNSFKPLKFT
jgi:hypothetical protein